MFDYFKGLARPHSFSAFDEHSLLMKHRQTTVTLVHTKKSLSIDVIPISRRNVFIKVTG